MLAARCNHFEARCDVCGTTETVEAASHAEAWNALKLRAWVVRKDAFPVVHVCPECPVEVSHERPD